MASFDDSSAFDEAAAVRRFVETRSEAAFRRLYREHTPYLWALALRLCAGRAGEAEEAVQEAWTRAAERLAGFRGGSALRTWLAGIVLNCCRELRRRRQPAFGAAATEPATHPTGHARLDLERLLAALPDGQREVVLLHHFQGFTHDEIATLLRIAPGTSKSRLFEARRRLRRSLETAARRSSARTTTRDTP